MSADYGFTLLWTRDIKEIQSKVSLYRYQKNGAELLSIENDDENKVFGITFRTPPSDSTGVAHILEHSVLCGSRKYPVKEPFVELLKGSLQTFLNAMTFPDKTCYPLASQNIQDFYNLIDVYLDAVFYPRITRDIFAQEGWHYELADENDILKFKGVVYNEMKGAYSSPDSLLNEYSQQSLFPDNTYGLDSGGNPEKIPDLTYDQFKSFHQTYYHPSNAKIFFYGDDDPQERLRILNEYLKDFDHIQVNSSIGLQPPFSNPLRKEHFYAAQEQETKNMITMNWLLGETDLETNIALHILEYILIGMPASPLRKALIESGLGEDLAGMGLEDELRQMFFSTGLKGVEEANLGRVEELILDTLSGLVTQGFDSRTVEAAMNTVEFILRENNTGAMPRGLIIMLRALSSWLYDRDPAGVLAFEKPLSSLKERLQAKEPIFERLLRDFILNNNHRSTVILKPDPQLLQKLERRQKQRLQQVELQMGPRKRRDLIERTLYLKKKQQQPDDPQDLAKIPKLKVDDLPRQETAIPLEVFDFEEQSNVLYHDLATNEIIYLDLGLDLSHLPQKYLGYVPLFARSLLEMGTDREDFVSLSQRIRAHTGGIFPHTFTSSRQNGRDSSFWLFLRGKAMKEKFQELIEILNDILIYANFNDQQRFKQILLEEKARQEQRLVPAGHRVVNTRLRSKYNLADWAEEHMSGVSYLLFLRYLAGIVDSDWNQILDSLEKVRNLLVNRKTMIFNITSDENCWKSAKPVIFDFLSRLPVKEVQSSKWLVDCTAGYEALTIPAQVNYVGKAVNLYEHGYEFEGSSLVITRYLRTSWLWDKIRVQGGAYGAFCNLDRFSGVMSFISYRDPNITDTLQAYDGTSQFLENAQLDETEIEKAIIGSIGDMDRYMLPDAKGFTSLIRYILNDTEAKRQKMREQIMETTKDDFRRFGGWLELLNKKGLIAVLGDQAQVSNAVQQGLKLDNIWQVL